MLYNIVLVSAVQQSESAVCIHISPFFWAFLPSRPPSHPFRSPQSTKLSSLLLSKKGSELAQDQPTNTWHSWEKFDDYERKRLQNQNAQFIYYKTVLMTSLIYFVCVMEKEMATHSNILAWKSPWTEKSGGLQPMGLQRVGHNWEIEHR